MREFEPVIGLEVHVELLTDTKIFCGCRTDFGAKPNSQTCPVCLGLPGARPVLNQKAVEYTIKAALALNCEIATYPTFDRKNYFYADLPNGYQISQYFRPIGTNGYVEIEVNGEKKQVGIRQIHLEEDTGSLTHAAGDIASSEQSLVDFNRAGVPLMEIVTKPDIRSGEEARIFLQKLRTILRYAGVSDCKMEEGSMRCDANVSIRPRGSEVFGTKTEIKNMNSTRSVQRGIEYEIQRQIELVNQGEEVIPQTRHWDENNNITIAMRSKYVAADYRCFPDPNVVPLYNDPAWVETIRQSLPEMPDARYQRMVEADGLPQDDAEIIVAERELADFYAATTKLYAKPKQVANWITGELLRLLKLENKEEGAIPITPENLADLLKLIDAGIISGKIAKTIFAEMFSSGKDPGIIVKEKGLTQITDEGQLEEIVSKVLADNVQSVEDFRAGKERAFGFLVGQVMKETKGKANPQLVNKLLREKIG